MSYTPISNNFYSNNYFIFTFLFVLLCFTRGFLSLPTVRTGQRTPRIVNGDPVERNDWVVGILFDNTDTTLGNRCGGSLIDSFRVLTAAHGFFEKVHSEDGNFDTVISRINILINSVNFPDVLRNQSEDSSDSFVVSRASRVLLHPDFGRTFLENDIAIIFLETPLTRTDLPFAQLPTPDQTFPSVIAETMGWGLNETNGTVSDILLRTEMRTMPNDVCSDRVQQDDRESVRPFHICAEGRFGADPLNGLEDGSCQGDSGGPLRVGNILIGIVSTNGAENIVCGQPGVPGRYTRVTHFLDWINENTGIPSGSTTSTPVTVPPREDSTTGPSGVMKEEQKRKIPKFEWSMTITYGGNRKTPEIVSNTKISHQGSSDLNIFLSPIFVWSA